MPHYSSYTWAYGDVSMLFDYVTAKFHVLKLDVAGGKVGIRNRGIENCEQGTA